MTQHTLEQLQDNLTKLQADYEGQRNALMKQIEQARKAAQSEAVAQIKAIMSTYGIAPADLSSIKSGKKSKASGSVAAQFKGPNGETWTGRGRQPKWIGGDKEKYRITG